MGKRKCIFTQDIQKKYPFIKKSKNDSAKVVCDVCNGDFNFTHDGKISIENHVKQDKHVRAVKAAASSKKVSIFFTDDKFALQTAIAEGVWAYHVISENHSFRSADCATKVIRNVFKLEKFGCARTKCESIAVNVLAPYVIDEVKNDLSNSRSVSLLTDASNHGNVKMFPVVARYFLPLEGVKVKVLQLTNESNEKSITITDLISIVMTNFGLDKKLVGFGADNAKVNFGGITQRGENNVFARLREKNPNLIGIGCAAHIIHNAAQAGCNGMPFDVEVILVKTYSHFRQFTNRVTQLEIFCGEFDVRFQSVLSYSKTRFLSMLPAINSILRIFPALKEYCNQSKDAPKILKDFYNNDLSQLWLLFLRDQVSTIVAQYFLLFF